MREMSILITETESKKNLVESELKEAVDKIWVLRDIIRDLEKQLDEKKAVENKYLKNIRDLELKVEQQLKINDEIVIELNNLKSLGDSEYLSQQIIKLDDEVNRLRLDAELIGSDSITKHIKTQVKFFICIIKFI